MIFSAAIVAEPMVYGMVLYGTAFVKGYGLLSAGECFTASSRLSWAVTSDAATATKNTVDHNRKSVDGIALLVLDVRDFENAEFYDPTIIESEGVNQWINEIKNHRDTNLTFKSSDSFQNNKCELPF
jgi:hypothetical protein